MAIQSTDIIELDQPPPTEREIDAACHAQRRFSIKAGSMLGAVAVGCFLLLAFFDMGGPLTTFVIMITIPTSIVPFTILCLLISKAHFPVSMTKAKTSDQEQLLALCRAVAPSPTSKEYRYIQQVLEQGRCFRRGEVERLVDSLQQQAAPRHRSINVE